MGEVGALEGEHWAKIAKKERARLLLELEGYEALEALTEGEVKSSTK